MKQEVRNILRRAVAEPAQLPVKLVLRITARFPGVALDQRATLATRNTRHFDDLHVPVVNSRQAANEVRG